MIVDKNENTVTITQQKLNIVDLIKKINASYSKFEHNNIIVNLNSFKKVSLTSIVEFLQLSNNHRSKKRSFVIVSETSDLDEMPDEIVVVPTIQEAHDIIEMEEMERDLGF
ncbi:MAG: ribonuclease Z [Bacteroidota bacterium]